MSSVIFNKLKSGKDKGYIGENVSQYEHGLQAAYFAKKMTDNPKVWLAALLHDIGHLIDNEVINRMYTNKGEDLGVKNHEKIGADYLRKLGLDEEICLLVENHVNTKRYLCGKDQSYVTQLSESSKKTLFEHQGGVMTESELIKFESDPLYKEHLLLRKCDELAKDPHFIYEEQIDDYLTLINLYITVYN